MAEIKYQSTHQHLKDRSEDSLDPVYLVWGEAFLRHRAVKALVNAIIPDPAKQKHGYEIINQKQDGHIVDAIEGLNTYSFFSEKKVIELRDATIFVTRENYDKPIRRAKKAYDNQDRGKELSASDSGNEAQVLKKAIERGFPQNNHLIISTDTVDRRTGLYKTIKKIGTVIDCSVAKGSRKAARAEQRKLLFQQLRRVLATHRKEMDSQVFEFMYDMIGFDLQAFENSLEKLIDYVGDRQRISLKDARSVLNRAREDPIYELTGAVCEKDIQKAVFYLSTLSSAGYHPLQLLAAITNQVRKLLVIKGFVKSPHGDTWHKGLDFSRFKTGVMPAVRKYDDALLNHLQEHGYDKPAADLLIVGNSANLYPVYQLFLRSDNFNNEQLYAAVEVLSRADIRLKTQGQNARSILEEVIFKICRP